MRIVHVLPSRAAEYGGPVRVAEALCDRAIREGHYAQIFPTAADRELPMPGFGYWPGLRQLRVLRSMVRGADLVHVHGLWTVPTSAAALFARVSERPFIITPHGMLDAWSLRQSARRKKVYARLIERQNLNAAAAVHFFNEDERREAQSFGIHVPTFLVPNGVELEQFAGLPGREELWARYPQTVGKKVALFLGRIHPKKGLPLLIEAFAELIRARSDLQLIVAGPDECGHRSMIEGLVASKNLCEHVVFTGPVVGEHKRMLLGGADVFVLPSHQEGDSVAVKEALAAGLPVIITHACHFPEVVEASAGVAVDPTVHELRGALERLFGDDSLRTHMASNARPLIERRYRWDILARELLQRYEEVLARRRSGSV